MKPQPPIPPNHHEFREAWLRDATMALRPYFASAGYSVPENIRFAIAFTSTGRRGNRRSESWHASSCITRGGSGSRAFEAENRSIGSVRQGRGQRDQQIPAMARGQRPIVSLIVLPSVHQCTQTGSLL
jgi:hypothetical protein